MFKKYTFITLSLLLIGMLPLHADVVFKHYKGASGRPLMDNGMQRVAEYHYYYYVSPDMQTVTSGDTPNKKTLGTYSSGGSTYLTLELPMMHYSYFTRTSTDRGNVTEPLGYYRWYDYTTDKASANVVKWEMPNYNLNASELKSINDENGADAGLFAYNITLRPSSSKTFKGPCTEIVGAAYKIPAEAANADWKGEEIACDVSRYTDYNDLTGYQPAVFTHEPTLSIRYIFHILPAKRMAQQAKDALLGRVKGSNCLEDNKTRIFGINRASSQMTLRMDQRYTRNYWFYAMNNIATHHVFTNSDSHRIVESDFDSSKVYMARCFLLREYDPTLTKYRQVYYQSDRSFTISLNALNNTSWADLNGNTRGVTAPTIKAGDRVYIVVYASNNNENDRSNQQNGSKFCPIASWVVTITSNYPMTKAELTGANVVRTTSYLESHFQRSCAPITFDNDNSSMTLAEPTSNLDNMSAVPSDFWKREYGFVYSSLLDKTSQAGSTASRQKYWYDPQYSPLHGEYGLYKSANYTNSAGTAVSTNVNQGGNYLWYFAPYNPSSYLLDKTHEDDNSKFGSFFYVDASEEPRDIAYEDFQGSLCSGSRVYMSAWVADLTAHNTIGTHNSRPQVLFMLYGITKDANGNVTSSLPLGSLASGDMETNVNGSDVKAATWYQVYGSFVLPNGSGADNYSDFRIVILNACGSTSGADYAVDDIELFQKTAKITVTQEPPICPDVDLDNTIVAPTNTTIQIKGSYDILKYLAGGATKVFYRFVNASTGEAVTDVNYGSADSPAYNYGVATLPATYNASAKLGTGLSDNSKSMFQITNAGDSLIYFCNRYFNLNPNATYYVSMAFPDTEGNPATWGTPSDACSIYSDNFTMGQQSFTISDGNGNIITNVTVSCNSTVVSDYDIHGSINTTDQENGGMITLDNVKYDWYIGSSSDFSAVTGLIEAIKDYRSVYPDRTDGNGAVSGVYTTDDANVLKANIYDATTNPDGKLLMTGSTSLTGYPLQVGVYKISAMPVTTQIAMGNYVYNLCPDPMQFTIRSVKQGVSLTLGMPGVSYPKGDNERYIRMGLPQITKMQASNGVLRIPIQSRQIDQKASTTADLRFVPAEYAGTASQPTTKVYLTGTNDPSLQSSVGTLQIADVESTDLPASSTTINLKFTSGIAQKLHEGYWYELGLYFITTNSSDETLVTCPGETYFELKIVPEYLTWTPTADNGANANWNNDANWSRSTAAELYKSNYTDYGTATYHGTDASVANSVDKTVTTQQTYVPMDFCKVIIPELQGKPYPTLGYIGYFTNNKVAMSLVNDKGNAATTNIEYDMMAAESSTTGTYDCENFRGNLCDQVYLKAGAEMRSQGYLHYNKAWMELQAPVNEWYTCTSPLKSVVAGDYYVPYINGRQETEAFTPITFSTTDNNRLRYPIYQRTWGTDAEEEGTSGSSSAWDDPKSMLPTTSVSENSNAWSHVYNNVSVNYGVAGNGFSMRMGDSRMPQGDDLRQAKALVRLPKADTEYGYFTPTSGSTQTGSVTINRDSVYRFVVSPDYSDGSLDMVTVTPTAVKPADNHYYLVGNPYTASISVQEFIQNNSAVLDSAKVWVLRANVLYELPAVNESSLSSSTDVIQPMESFFVKMKEPEKLTFTKALQVDPNIKNGTAATAGAKPVYITYKYDDATGIDKVEQQGALQCWNPSTGEIAVNYTGNGTMKRIDVVTVDGKLVRTVTAPRIGVNYIQCARGIYLVKAVTTDGDVKVTKLLVK